MLAVMIMVGLSVLVLGYLSTAVDSGRRETQEQKQQSLENQAESVLALAVHDIWGDFQRTYATRRRTHWDFKFYLENLGITDQGGMAIPARTDRRANLGLDEPTPGQYEFGGSRVNGVDIWRVDGTTNVSLFVEVSVSDRPLFANMETKDTQHVTQQVFQIAGLAWDGLDYALLANNLNCIMCHAEVDNAERYYNNDSGLWGEYERVKVGSLESIWFREDPESWIAGTLYLRGKALEAGGAPFTDWTNLNLKSRQFGLDGLIAEDSWGQMVETGMSPAHSTLPDPMANLYLDYGADGAEQVDGYMPDVFPPPIPDDGGFDFANGTSSTAGAGNRIVDPEEFDAATALVTGTLSGGSIGVHDPATAAAIGDSAALATFTAGGAPSLSSVTDGSVYLEGTVDNPILLNGDIAIDGDLVISGYVKGTGSILVSGNVYMPSDVLYADGTDGGGERTFGTGSDGTENILAIASGGNVIVGDIFRDSWGDDGDVTGYEGGGFNFILEEVALFNRMEWLKTQATLPGETVKTKVGEETVSVQKWNWESYEYEAEVPVYDNSSGYPIQTGTQTVTKTGWQKVGDPWFEDEVKGIYEYNTPTHANPYYEGPDYLARYYAFTDYAQVPVPNREGHFDPATDNWIADERVTWWDSSEMTMADPTDSSDPLLFNGDGSPKAVVSTLTASSGWLSNDMLNELMKTGLAARDASKAFEVDATVYSNNSIFGIFPARDSVGTDGRLIVNGSVVAADVGLLSPTSLQLNYDGRGGSMLDIRADTEVQIRRLAQVPVRH